VHSCVRECVIACVVVRACTIPTSGEHKFKCLFMGACLRTSVLACVLAVVRLGVCTCLRARVRVCVCVLVCLLSLSPHLSLSSLPLSSPFLFSLSSFSVSRFLGSVGFLYVVREYERDG
jgi:hypothetical protein